MKYAFLIKPIFDFFIALFAILLLSPIFLLAIVAIRFDSRGPAFFIQERVGRNGLVFKIYKFRSMSVDMQYQTNQTLSSDPRITKVGHFIRKTSIDELPQLINILKGDMSFIGPRPPLPHYPKVFADYNEFEKQRFLVKPGMSGYAAVKQRAVHDWNQNIPLDVEYVKRISFLLDAHLFIYSLFAFFRTNNIYTSV